jgi:hypothetical protein
MSIGVELHELAGAITDKAPFAYLLTTGDDARPHAVAVTPAIDGAVITCSAGRRSCANTGARPAVSLVWPPGEPGGYSLIVDGDATVGDEQVTMHPTRAVLHRPAPGGGSDCAPVQLG